MVHYILDGLYSGFNIGYEGSYSETRPKNLKSATNNSIKVTEAIVKELERKHTAGPFVDPPFSPLHCSPIGAVMKDDGTCRLIMDLSQPKGYSINEGINKDDFAVQYSHFDRATELVFKAGQGCLLSKIDIKHAFRLIPVAPEDWKLLGFFWENYYFIDVRLSFGSRSSPGIFNKFADLVCWILINKCNLESTVHYSDDFLLVSGTEYVTARHRLDVLIKLFKDLNIPLALEKLVGPDTILPYLGIDIDSENLTIGIPKNKFDELMDILSQWDRKRKTCKKRELLSLIGKLSFFCKVVRAGRIFLRRLIDLSTTVESMDHHININSEAREDIRWWVDLLPQLKTHSLIPECHLTTSDDLKLFTDASSKIAFGAIFGCRWIQHRWTESERANMSIDVMELFAIVAAILTFGHEWEGKRIVVMTDNLPITQLWESGSSPTKALMFLIRRLYLVAAKNGFSVALKHIFGKTNCVADAISRFQMPRFRHLVPEADAFPTTLPRAVTETLVDVIRVR